MDKFLGGLTSFVLGDCIGFPYESHKSHFEFTPIITKQKFSFNRFKNEYTEYPLGCISDDTELLLALMDSVLELNEYNEENTILKYIEVATYCKTIGKNTRELFKGIKTIKGFRKRYDNKFGKTIEINSWTQSNGALMRCFPLIYSIDSDIITDCMITNPSPVCVFTNLIYLEMCKTALETSNYNKIIHSGQNKINQLLLKKFESNQPIWDSYVYNHVNEFINPIQDVFNDAIKKIPRNINGFKKGWCLNSFYCAIYVLDMHDINEAFEWIIKGNYNSDTDTNCAIAGALLGCRLGYKKIMKSNLTKTNWKIINETIDGNFISFGKRYFEDILAEKIES